MQKSRNLQYAEAKVSAYAASAYASAYASLRLMHMQKPRNLQNKASVCLVLEHKIERHVCCEKNDSVH